MRTLEQDAAYRTLWKLLWERAREFYPAWLAINTSIGDARHKHVSFVYRSVIHYLKVRENLPIRKGAMPKLYKAWMDAYSENPGLALQKYRGDWYDALRDTVRSYHGMDKYPPIRPQAAIRRKAANDVPLSAKPPRIRKKHRRHRSQSERALYRRFFSRRHEELKAYVLEVVKELHAAWVKRAVGRATADQVQHRIIYRRLDIRFPALFEEIRTLWNDAYPPPDPETKPMREEMVSLMMQVIKQHQNDTDIQQIEGFYEVLDGFIGDIHTEAYNRLTGGGQMDSAKAAIREILMTDKVTEYCV